MVIYLLKKREVLIKILIFIILFLFVYGLSYFISYIKYDNRKYLDSSYLVLENQLLKKELHSIGTTKYKDAILAKVIIRDIYSFYDEVIINVGSNDNVIEGDAVINEDGLVGIVYKVDKNRCYVKLLSSNYNISVKVDDTYGNLNKGIITMLDKYSKINKGDLVYTSGLDNVLGNIYIGKVSDVTYDKEGLGKEVKLEYNDNTYLNYVYVVGKIK